MSSTFQNNAGWDCFKTLILQETLKTRSQHQENSVHFRKSHVGINKLDVQEIDFCFTQFYRSWNYFSRCRFTHGWDSRSRSLGFRMDWFGGCWCNPLSHARCWKERWRSERVRKCNTFVNLSSASLIWHSPVTAVVNMYESGSTMAFGQTSQQWAEVSAAHMRWLETGIQWMIQSKQCMSVFGRSHFSSWPTSGCSFRLSTVFLRFCMFFQDTGISWLLKSVPIHVFSYRVMVWVVLERRKEAEKIILRCTPSNPVNSTHPQLQHVQSCTA